MKFIFDFDDVLFDNTKQFKEHMYMHLEKVGVPRSKAEAYYKSIPGNQFWLRELLTHFAVTESLYDTILDESKNFLNKELIDLVKKLGKNNCYIVSHGYGEWQIEKIKRTGIEPLFLEIVIVPESKKAAVEKICARHKDEKVIFIDDKIRHFETLDLVKYPNLKTILFDEKGFEKLLAEIEIK